MRIATWNVNGLRAALRKGFEDTLEKINADIWLLQEVRALPEQLPAKWQAPDNWQAAWHSAEKKGYSGVAVLSKKPFKILGTGLDTQDPDSEGRVLRIECDGLSLASIYLPSGSSGEARQIVKDQWLERFEAWTNSLQGPWVIGGDFNVVHTAKDIFHAKSNQNTSGYLPHERAWLGRLLQQGWQDTHRADFQALLEQGDTAKLIERYGVTPELFNPQEHGPYSWWSNRGQARATNRGWRIDYLLSKHCTVDNAGIDRESALTISDHAPCWCDIKI